MMERKTWFPIEIGWPGAPLWSTQPPRGPPASGFWCWVLSLFQHQPKGHRYITPHWPLSSSTSYAGRCPAADWSLQLTEAEGYYLLLPTLHRILRKTKKRIFREVPLDSKDEKSGNCAMIWMCLYFPLWLSLARMFSSDDSWADWGPLVKSSNSINLWLEMTVKVSARLFGCGFSSSFQSCQASSERNRSCGKGNRW